MDFNYLCISQICRHRKFMPFSFLKMHPYGFTWYPSCISTSLWVWSNELACHDFSNLGSPNILSFILASMILWHLFSVKKSTVVSIHSLNSSCSQTKFNIKWRQEGFSGLIRGLLVTLFATESVFVEVTIVSLGNYFPVPRCPIRRRNNRISYIPVANEGKAWPL
jgi:hypothetical protein